MKKGIVISIVLLFLGFIFECLHFATDIKVLEFKSWMLGVICFVLGALGLLWYAVVPILEIRAEKLGKFKKKVTGS